MTAFIITFRESLEAGVIVGILFSILASFHAMKHAWFVWGGVILGIICSILFYFAFTFLGNGFSGASEKIYEGVLMIGASILITHMVFWMRKTSKGIHKRMTEKVQTYITNGTLWMVGIIAFLSVVREGVETVIFFSALNVQSGGMIQIIFALLGVVAAVILSVMIYTGSKKIDIKTFFRISGFLLLLVSAGLLAHGVVELQGAGVVPTYIKPLYDLSPILSEKEGLGMVLKAIFGYDANPSLLAVIVYIVFLPLVLLCCNKKEG